MFNKEKSKLKEFKDLAGQLKSQGQREREVHERIAEEPNPFIKQAIYSEKVINRWSDLVKLEHWSILQTRMRLLQSKAEEEARYCLRVIYLTI